jgi:hypothetical protein
VLNLSAVAQEAFTQAVRIEELRKVDMNSMQIERLRNSRKVTDESERARGAADGKTWALDTAEFADLERLVSVDIEELARQIEGDDVAIAIYRAVDDDDDERYLRAGAEELFGDPLPQNRNYYAGFIEGATEIYSQV